MLPRRVHWNDPHAAFADVLEEDEITERARPCVGLVVWRLVIGDDTRQSESSEDIEPLA